jgi:hypothetical protein
MNKTDVIRTVSEKAGIESNICEKVIKAFEEQAGDALVGTFKGTKTSQTYLKFAGHSSGASLLVG